MTNPKSGLVSSYSNWAGRWKIYWRIQQMGNIAPMAERLAEKYPRTWEVRLILWHLKHTPSQA